MCSSQGWHLPSLQRVRASCRWSRWWSLWSILWYAWLHVGTVCDAGARAFAQQPRLFVGVILEIILIMSIYAEALGLYGLIVPKSNVADCEELG